MVQAHFLATNKYEKRPTLELINKRLVILTSSLHLLRDLAKDASNHHFACLNYNKENPPIFRQESS